MIYFDHNATTPLLPEARQAWVEASEKFIGNPSSPHRMGSRADTALSEAREKLAAFLGCHALEIVFTSGASESSNMLWHHYSRIRAENAEVWISAIEHPCVLEPARNYFPESLRLIPVSRDGVVDLNWIERELKRSRPALIAIMAANNETGVLQPWGEAMQLCRQHGVPFFCDAAQWIGKLPARGLGGCDWLSGCAHKFGGPKGVGFLKTPQSGSVTPLIQGGPQEESRRAGTENVAGVLSMMRALEAREEMLARAMDKERTTMRDEFERNFLRALPGSKIAGRRSPRLWNTVSALMPDVDCRQRWVVKLDKLGVAVSTGSACASGKEEVSHVLSAMGYSASEGTRVLRFSSGWETEPREWDALFEALGSVFSDVKSKKSLARRPVLR